MNLLKGDKVLPDSRIYSFIDSETEFTIHFVEGQKLVHDLAIIHDLKGQGFAYFRESVLSAIPLVSLLKAKENLGLYVDSKEPYFLLKIEMNELGYFRTLLLPESFDKFPEKLKGEGRLSKISVGMNTPYTSIIQVDGLSFREVVNSILKDSYQIKGQVICSEQSDQSVFVRQLPRKNWDKENPLPEPDFDGLLSKIEPGLNDLFAKGTTDQEEIKAFFESHDFNFLMSKDLDFKCSCSYERMVLGVQSLLNTTSIDEIFESDKSIETKCDYCKTYYQIPKTEFLKD